VTSYWQNPRLLALLALGTNGGQPLADETTLDTGIHLRWHFNPEVGFPPGGFNVYRREHQPGTVYCADFRVDEPIILWDSEWVSADVSVSGEVERAQTCRTAGQYKNGFRLPGKQTLEFDLNTTANTVTVTFGRATRTTPKGIAYWDSASGEVEVARAEAVEDPVTGHYTLTFQADAIDRVIITARNMRACELCVIPVEDDLSKSWGEPLNTDGPIHLPATHPDWPGVHPHQPDDAAEAEARLPSGLAADQSAEYVAGFSTDVHGMLYDLVGWIVQTRYWIDDPGVSEDDLPAPTGFSWRGIDLLHLVSIDPNFARILGLYWHDVPPDPNTYYDYRIEGLWEGALHPATDNFFEDLAPATRSTTFVTSAGLQVTSPEPLEVVRGVYRMGIETNGLYFTSVIPQSSIVIALPDPVPSVALHLDCDGDVRVKAFLGVDRVKDLTVGLGSHNLRIDDVGHFGKLKLQSDDPLTLIGVVTREQAETIEEINYVTFHHRQEAPPDVLVPEIETMTALPAASAFADDGERLEGQNAAGLRWELNEAGGDYLHRDAPVLYHVERSEGGNGNQPDPNPLVTILNEDNPAVVSDGGLTEARPEGWPEEHQHFIDRHLADGWYAYRVRGIDLFGRLGDWSSRKGLRLLDAVAPPSPVRVEAVYLDPADPQITAADLPHAPGTKASWEWSGACRLQAPEVENGGEFRVYFREGELNVLTGVIVSVTASGDQLELQTDHFLLESSDNPVGEWLHLDGTYFEITAIDATGDLRYTVEMPAGLAEFPSPGPYRINATPARSYTIDYRDPANWRVREHVEPAQATSIVRGALTDVVEVLGSSTVHVTTDQVLDDNAGVFTPGVLISGGVVYQARAHDPSATPLTLTLQAQEIPSDPPSVPPAEVIPQTGAYFVYYPGQVYTVYLPGLTLSPSPAEPTAVGHIAVSTSDNLPYVPDEWQLPPNQDRPGNEGPVSPPRRIVAVQRTRPAAPGNVPAAGADPIFAAPADFYGQARYTLAWEAVQDAASYAVYRCSGAALFDRDLALRKRGVAPYDADPFHDDPGFAAWLADAFPGMPAGALTDEAWRVWAARFYPGLTDLDIQVLADLTDNAAAFSRVNTDTVIGLSYPDVFDGRGRGVVIYKVRAIDVAGNPGDFSPAYPPVHLYDVTPPARPVVTAVLGEQEAVRIEWRANTEPDLDAYWIWQADRPGDLADAHRQAPAAVLPVTPGAVQESHTIGGLQGGQNLYVVLAAVDTSGNLSQRTPILQARAFDTLPPDPPTWISDQWISDGLGDGVKLNWAAAEPGLTCTLYRRPMGGGTWRAVSPPLNAGAAPLEFSYIDRDVVISAGYEYHVRAEDPAGNRAGDYTVRTVYPGV